MIANFLTQKPIDAITIVTSGDSSTFHPLDELSYLLDDISQTFDLFRYRYFSA